jgi:hypothetical protein
VQLVKILDSSQNDYKCLEVEGCRLSKYNSQYFDTDGYHFYFQHHRSKAGRIKVRIRTYVDSKLSFLEIKRKNKKGQTVKKRLKTEGFADAHSNEQVEFLENAKMPSLQIKPILENSFNRITLVNKDSIERVTIDTSLLFNNRISFTGSAGALAIIEVKQPGLDRSSPIIKALKKEGIRPQKVSKYCIGLAKLNPNLKQNSFKSKILKINKTIA